MLEQDRIGAGAIAHDGGDLPPPSLLREVVRGERARRQRVGAGPFASEGDCGLGSVDPHLDALIAQMRGTLDTKAREAVVAQIQRYIADKALWAPLWTNYVYLALQPRVHGVLRDPQGNVILNNATLSS